MEAILIKLFTICLVLIISFGIYYVYKKQGTLLNLSRPHRIQIIDTLQLEPKKKVTLIKCNGVNHLILSNQINDVLIASFNDNERIDLKNTEDIKIMINNSQQKI